MESRRGTVEVLIVEDSPTQAEQLKYLLEERGYNVTVAPNGKEALAAVHRRKPAIIISDILMPEMDGYALCKEIKSEEKLKDIPVILVTSLSGLQDVIKGLQCGADNFIRKPYDERYLLSRIEHILVNQEVRKDRRVEMGVEIYLAGQRHFITSERQQILDLLVSTYEEAVRINEELKARQKDLVHSYQSLNGLFRIAEGLNQCTSEGEVAEKALERTLELPGVRAGWVSLREGQTGFRIAAARGLPPALQEAGALEGDCLCRRKLLSGELNYAANILECERLKRAKGEAQSLSHHVSIPLVVSDRTLGIMNLAGAEGGPFSDEDLKALYAVGNQIGAALERSRLYENLERQVEERTADLTAEIAERRRAEEALIAKGEELKVMSQQLWQAAKLATMGELAASIAHELNNPLTTVSLRVELLLAQVSDDDPKRRALEVIEGEVGRMGSLVANLLQSSRRSGQQISTVDVREEIDNTLELVRYHLIKGRIAIVREFAPDVPMVQADRGQLRQLFLNLFTNAGDAMPEGGTLTIRVGGAERFVNRRIGESEKGGLVSHSPLLPLSDPHLPTHVVIEITDTGIGIAPEDLPKVMEPFFTTKPEGKGTGLGLPICRRIAQEHHGTLEIESEVGKGTVVRVRLPVANGSNAAHLKE